MTDGQSTRRPSAFTLDDPRLVIADNRSALTDDQAAELLAASPPAAAHGKSGWGKLFLGAIGGLLVLSVLMWVQNAVLSLLSRQDWLGFAATGLLALAALSFIMILVREIVALGRLSAMTALRQRADIALHSQNTRDARAASKSIQAAFEKRPEFVPSLRDLKHYDGEVLDARQVLALAERLVILKLDEQARTVIGSAGRRVAGVTSISPSAIVDVAFVAFENVRLLRSLATIYGGRPGFFATLRLFRLIAGHLAVTGGLALTDGLMQQLIGHGVAARLSRRLSEGLINGAFTIRIGLAAVAVLRPLPYIEAQPPKLREFAAEFLKFGGSRDKSRAQ